MSSPDEAELLDVIRKHRDLFERLAESDLPISQDAERGLARLDSSENGDE